MERLFQLVLKEEIRETCSLLDFSGDILLGRKQTQENKQLSCQPPIERDSFWLLREFPGQQLARKQ